MLLPEKFPTSWKPFFPRNVCFCCSSISFSVSYTHSFTYSDHVLTSFCEREVKWKSLSHVRLWDPMDCISLWSSPGENTGVGSLSRLQGIISTQRSNLGLPHCGWILYQLSHKGSSTILEWVAYPFSSGSSRPRNQTKVCTAGKFFTNWAIREAPLCEHTGKLSKFFLSLKVFVLYTVCF